jgi:hypothetical protein
VPGDDPRRPLARPDDAAAVDAAGPDNAVAARPASGRQAGVPETVWTIDGVASLYHGAPERFVAERDELAAALHRKGRHIEARQVGALHRPSALVWALDRLGSEHPDSVEELGRTGRSLRAAQAAVVRGAATTAELHEATADRRRVVLELADAAAAHAGAGVHERAVLALEAVSVDPVGFELLRSGRLSCEPAPRSDLGGAAEVTVASDGGEPRTPSVSTGSPADPRAGPTGDQGATGPRDARDARARAGRRLRLAEEALDEAEHEERLARAEHHDAEERLRDRERRLSAATARVQDAAAALHEAQLALGVPAARS